MPDVHIVEGDLLDQASLMNVIQKVKPDEVYNLAAISFVALSWNQPELTGEITGLGALRVLEAIRLTTGASGSRAKSAAGIKFYQASSSEMFGKVRETPQNEQTPFHPRSPYGVAKAYAHYITVNYRESYNIFACSGILFNHESPRRGPEFVTRKITLGAARIKLGLQKELLMGNLDTRRDWGFAGDYVKAMHLMMQAPQADDYVIGTGETHQGKEWAQLAFERVGLNWQDYVKSDPQFMRPGRGRPLDRRSVEGEEEVEVEAEGLVRRAHRHDGGRTTSRRRRGCSLRRRSTGRTPQQSTPADALEDAMAEAQQLVDPRDGSRSLLQRAVVVGAV